MAADDKREIDTGQNVSDDENENGQQQQAGTKKSKLPLIIILIVFLFLIAGGAAGAYFFFLKPNPQSAEVKPAAVEQPKTIVFFPMEPFIVNLLDNETERYLKVTMQVELSEQRTVDELRRLNPILRDTILDLLTSKTYREMIDPLGKQRLRDEIATRLNMILDHNKGRVNKVYFTEFVIQ